ncbi:MAG: TlpA family protein disulfide reductase [Ktedonobacterales bacterium]
MRPADPPRDSAPTPAADDPSSARQSTTPARRIPRIAAVFVAVASVVILLWALLSPAQGAVVSHGGPTATAAAAAPQVGHYAPNVTLLDLSNQRVDIASLRGKVVVLNFWYVACAPCQLEMPELEHAYLAHQAQGFEVVGVNISDDAQTISNFLKQLGVTYPVLRDQGERAVLAYRLTDTPVSFFLDRQGVIRYRYVGPLDNATLDQYTTILLKN